MTVWTATQDISDAQQTLAAMFGVDASEGGGGGGGGFGCKG